MSETEGQAEFKRLLIALLAGQCVTEGCNRRSNKQGSHCCRMCRDGYGTHSKLCRKNNE